MPKVDSETGEIAGPADPISVVLERIRGGEFAQEAGDALAGLVRTCTLTQRSGTFTVTMNVKPDDTMIKVEVQYAAKPPKGDPVGAIFWTDDDGHLHRSDPNQPTLFGNPNT